MPPTFSESPISQTLNFSNIPITRAKSRFPWTCFTVIVPPIFQTPDFLNQFSFPLEVREIGIPLTVSAKCKFVLEQKKRRKAVGLRIRGRLTTRREHSQARPPLLLERLICEVKVKLYKRPNNLLAQWCNTFTSAVFN